MVNEDPNAKLVRELRAEVERLKQMLISANPDLMLEKSPKPREKRQVDLWTSLDQKIRNIDYFTVSITDSVI